MNFMKFDTAADTVEVTVHKSSGGSINSDGVRAKLTKIRGTKEEGYYYKLLDEPERPIVAGDRILSVSASE